MSSCFRSWSIAKGDRAYDCDDAGRDPAIGNVPNDLRKGSRPSKNANGLRSAIHTVQEALSFLVIQRGEHHAPIQIPTLGGITALDSFLGHAISLAGLEEVSYT